MRVVMAYFITNSCPSFGVKTGVLLHDEYGGSQSQQGSCRLPCVTCVGYRRNTYKCDRLVSRTNGKTWDLVPHP